MRINFPVFNPSMTLVFLSANMAAGQLADPGINNAQEIQRPVM